MIRNNLSLGWSSAAPLWHTFTKTEGFSPAGATVSYQLRLNRHFSLGPDIQWQLLEGTSTIKDNPNSISTSMHAWHERRFLSAAVTTHYYFVKRDTMLPYVSASVGGMRVRERRGVMVDTNDIESWHVLVAPEIGMYLLYGRIPVWLNTRLGIGIPTADVQGEILLLLTLGVTVPH